MNIFSLVLLLFTISFPSTHSAKKNTFCSMHGNYNSKTRRCDCLPQFSGSTCDEKECPRGYDWFAPPHNDHQAHASNSVCSGAGECDRTVGSCTCKDGFVGSACEIMDCPKGLTNSTTLTVLNTCSGHGRCMSMLDASREYTGVDSKMGWGGLVKGSDKWDGNLKQSAYESKWDANQIHGCVCDSGYTGYNCSQFECPWGLDSSVSDDKYGLPIHNEVLRFECAATRGTFRFSFRGQTSRDIGFDWTHGRVKRALQELTSVHDIELSMSGGAICGSSSNAPVVTTVKFVDQPGKLPPAKLTPHITLKLNGGSDPILNMITRTTIVCPKMWSGPDQFGGMHLRYNGETTRFINFTDTVLDVESALRNLTTVRHHSNYGHVNVTASTSNGGLTICSLTSQTNTTVDMKSLYGNLYELEILDSMEISNQLSNFTAVSQQATSEILECSGRGRCEYTSGTCECFFKAGMELANIFHRFESSDGTLLSDKNLGSKGDCGKTTIPPKKCPGGLTNPDDLVSYKTCYNNGFCQNSTYTCKCSDGYQGGDCFERTCPFGTSWFDQMNGDGHAHSTKQECSGQGICTDSGVCHCRTGFTGRACDKLVCGDSQNKGCGTFGSCQPLHQLAKYSDDEGHPRSIPYGFEDKSMNLQDTWDRDIVQACLCDGENTRGQNLGPLDTYISGSYVNQPTVPAYHGYACHQIYCPFGDDPDSPGVSEQQLIKCNKTSGTFMLSFRGEKTSPIAYNANAATLKAAFEVLSTVETTTVTLGDAAACAANAGVSGFTIQFDGNGGDLPNVESFPSFLISEAVKGTTEYLECSGRGTCLSELGKPLSGMCNCDKGYMSSDGAGSRGVRRDCGAYDETMTALGYYTT